MGLRSHKTKKCIRPTTIGNAVGESLAQQFSPKTQNPLYSLVNKNGPDSGQSFGEFQRPDYGIASDGARRLPFIGSDGTQGNLSEVSSSVGGYDPEDLAAAGYPSDARFIDAPLDRKGNRIAAKAGAERTELYDGVIPILASNGDPNSYTVPIQGLVNFTNYPVKYLPEGFLKPTDRAFYAFDSAGQAFYNINGRLTAPLAPYNVPTLNELNGEAFRTGFVDSAKAAPGAFIDFLDTLNTYAGASQGRPTAILQVLNDVSRGAERASLLGVDGVVNSVGSGIYDISKSISPLGVLRGAASGDYYGAGGNAFNVAAILAEPGFTTLGTAGVSAAGRQYRAFSNSIPTDFGQFSFAGVNGASPTLKLAEGPTEAASISAGRYAAESPAISQESILRSLRQAGTPESLASAKLISLGKLKLNILPTDPTNKGLGGLYRIGSTEIEIYKDASTSVINAAGFATHEATHFLQGLTRYNYNLGHEVAAFRAQGAVDSSHFSNALTDKRLYDFISNHPVYKGVKPSPKFQN